jgi:heme A synthase
MVSRENKTMVASVVVAIAVIVALRTFTDLGTVPRFAIVIVAILVTQSVLGRVGE